MDGRALVPRALLDALGARFGDALEVRAADGDGGSHLCCAWPTANQHTDVDLSFPILAPSSSAADGMPFTRADGNEIRRLPGVPSPPGLAQAVWLRIPSSSAHIIPDHASLSLIHI